MLNNSVTLISPEIYYENKNCNLEYGILEIYNGTENRYTDNISSFQASKGHWGLPTLQNIGVNKTLVHFNKIGAHPYPDSWLIFSGTVP